MVLWLFCDEMTGEPIKSRVRIIFMVSHSSLSDVFHSFFLNAVLFNPESVYPFLVAFSCYFIFFLFPFVL